MPRPSTIYLRAIIKRLSEHYNIRATPYENAYVCDNPEFTLIFTDIGVFAVDVGLVGAYKRKVMYTAENSMYLYAPREIPYSDPDLYEKIIAAAIPCTNADEPQSGH